MPKPFVTQSDIASYANSKVNIFKDDLKNYRAQVGRLTEKSTIYINEQPD